MGTQQTPPNQVLIAVALFLTLFIMTPTLSKINNESLTPYLNGDLAAKALKNASNIVKKIFSLILEKMTYKCLQI